MGALEEYASIMISRQKAADKVWVQPEIKDFAEEINVLSFDQSLGKTGWINLTVRWGEIEVARHGTLRTVTSHDGFQGSFDRANHLRVRMFEEHGWLAFHGLPGEVIMEMPAVRGHRIESSFLAAYVVQEYCIQFWKMPTMVSIQESRRNLAGPGTHNDKKAGHLALARLIPESASRQWNEDERDAALNALNHLYKLKQECT
jgi:hypothetical protein